MNGRNATAAGYHPERIASPVSEYILKAPSLVKLIEGYLITLKSEGKSPQTISYHTQLLRDFLWWCEQYTLPQDVEHITTSHIRHFLTYLQREPVRWGGRVASAGRPASQRTLQHYQGNLHVFFHGLSPTG